MSQWRNLTDEPRDVIYGLASARRIQPDAVVTVDDSGDTSYAIQPTIWGPADSGATAAVEALNPPAKPETEKAPPAEPAQTPAAPAAETPAPAPAKK